MKFWTISNRKPGEGVDLSVLVQIKYNDYDPYTLAKFKDRIVPICYRFEFGNSIKVRVLQFEYLMFECCSYRRAM